MSQTTLLSPIRLMTSQPSILSIKTPSRTFTHSSIMSIEGPPSLLEIVKQLKCPARWVVISSFAVAATVEGVFWTKVIQIKLFAKEGDTTSPQTTF